MSAKCNKAEWDAAARHSKRKTYAGQQTLGEKVPRNKDKKKQKGSRRKERIEFKPLRGPARKRANVRPPLRRAKKEKAAEEGERSGELNQSPEELEAGGRNSSKIGKCPLDDEPKQNTKEARSLT